MAKKPSSGQHIFIIMMILLFIIAIPVTVKHLFFQNTPSLENSPYPLPSFTPQSTQSEQSPGQSATAPADETASSSASGQTPGSTAPTPPTEPVSTSENTDGFTTVSKDYFKDALFIGDSRTVGLYEYSSIKDTTYFADIGMSSFNVFKKEIGVPSKGKTTLDNLLQNNSFKKIYIMLGINEIGYPYNSIVSKYSETIGKLKAAQPDAIIYVQANLHITKRKSDRDNVYNNANIDRINSAISQLADNKRVFYIDVNVLFDDANGALDEKYTRDGAHVLGKYYMTWGDWLCTQAVVTD